MPTSKVPVKLNLVNFEGAFNNVNMFQDQQTPAVKNVGPSGSSRGNWSSNRDISNLIHVSL